MKVKLGSTSAFLGGAALLLGSQAAIADTITPEYFSASLEIGESVTLTKTFTVTNEAPTGGILDVMFLIDTSGSMGSQISLAKTAAADILTGLSSFGDVASGVGYYSDPGSDGSLYGLSTDASVTTSNINLITLGQGGNGGDFPEEGIKATYDAATETLWRPGSSRIIIALGDANFKESDGVTLAMAQAALGSSGATFIGIDFRSMATSLSGGISAENLSNSSGGSIVSSSGMSTTALVNDIMSGVSSAFDSYTEVSVDDFGAGLPGVDVSVSCVSADIGACAGDTAFGSYDRSITREFIFDVTFTALEEGVYEFDTYGLVDGGATATEYDTITVTDAGAPQNAVSEPQTLAMMALGLLGVAAVRRRKTEK